MDDYIKRKYAINVVCTDCLRSNCDECAVRKRLKGVPAADVKPVVRGKWRRALYFIHLDGLNYRCSECLGIADTMSNYCPNCGADMREGER